MSDHINHEENSPAESGLSNYQQQKLQHVEMVSRQLELSAKELIGYVARIDRLERKMIAHSIKTSGRLVGVTRRADAVIDALEQRSGTLARICDEIGVRNARSHDPDIDQPSDSDDLIDHIEMAAAILSALAQRLADHILLDASDLHNAAVVDCLEKLRGGMEALDVVMEQNRAA